MIIHLKSASMSDFLTRRNGEAVVPKIRTALDEGDSVVLDFNGIETALPSFFNALVGAAYPVKLENLPSRISCLNLNDLQSSAWHTAIENALAFARDPEEREARRRAAVEAIIES